MSLIGYSDEQRTTRPTRQHRLMAAQARPIRDEVRLAALKADGAIALGHRIMEGVVRLDDRRRYLAKDDGTLNLVLGEIEMETIQQVRRIQSNLYNDWGI